jgi:hypothetical protein
MVGPTQLSIGTPYQLIQYRPRQNICWTGIPVCLTHSYAKLKLIRYRLIFSVEPRQLDVAKLLSVLLSILFVLSHQYT